MALTLLGESRILSLADNSKPAREAAAMYDIARDSLLGGYNWSFAKTRAQLPASTDIPAFEFDYIFPLPSDCLRLTFIGDYYVGADMSDYRGAPSDIYTIEGRNILTSLDAPLNVKYIRRVTDTTLFAPNFVSTFASRLAVMLAEPLTQSDSKRMRAEDAYKKELSIAIRANAIELPPQSIADSEWILARL
jgi:hypothetical protein